jgi:hypothetical protein
MEHSVQFGVDKSLLLNLVYGMNDGGVMLSPKYSADLGKRGAG